MIAKIIAFAVVSSEEIDASRFSGTEQFLYGAPLISTLLSTIDFSTIVAHILKVAVAFRNTLRHPCDMALALLSGHGRPDKLEKFQVLWFRRKSISFSEILLQIVVSSSKKNALCCEPYC